MHFIYWCKFNARAVAQSPLYNPSREGIVVCVIPMGQNARRSVYSQLQPEYGHCGCSLYYSQYGMSVVDQSAVLTQKLTADSRVLGYLYTIWRKPSISNNPKWMNRARQITSATAEHIETSMLGAHWVTRSLGWFNLEWSKNPPRMKERKKSSSDETACLISIHAHNFLKAI
jgi:hypothetical protein